MFLVLFGGGGYLDFGISKDGVGFFLLFRLGFYGGRVFRFNGLVVVVGEGIGRGSLGI